MTTDGVAELTSRYVTNRDNFTARYKAVSTGLISGKSSLGGPMALNGLITEHAVQFAALMPPLTLAQWEGLSELASSYLAHIRLMEVGKR